MGPPARGGVLYRVSTFLERSFYGTRTVAIWDVRPDIPTTFPVWGTYAGCHRS